MQKRKDYNPKRKIAASNLLTPAQRAALAVRISYGGNGEHKLRPGDYGLAAPPNPRPGKMLCDAKGPFPLADAEALLRSGAAKGMISEQRRNGWPQNIWAVSDAGLPFEAQLENRATGVYHGYPMAEDDDFRAIVMREWSAR
jgi:hypothetical protein